MNIGELSTSPHKQAIPKTNLSWELVTVSRIYNYSGCLLGGKVEVAMGGLVVVLFCCGSSFGIVHFTATRTAPSHNAR